MARWRAPRPKSSPYITADGEVALKRELQELWRLRRQDVVPALSAAAAEGDRSENAEYIYRKKQLAEIDRRIRYLSRRLDEVEVVRQAPSSRERIYFGAFVVLENEQGERLRYRVVGADETDAEKGYISVDSPLARALVGRQVDESVTVQRPEDVARFRVLQIDYEQ
jgi:transcription elongation factor GreB